MKTQIPLVASVVLLAGFALTSCATPATPPVAAGHSSTAETSAPARLVVASENGVAVHDAAGGGALADFQLGTAPTLTPLDGSGEVIVTEAESGDTWVLDTGLRMVSHGDHEDLQVSDPSAGPVATSGDRPSHVEVAHGKVAVFYDGSGTADVFTEHSLTGANPAPFLTQAAASPHHGVAVPRFEGILMTQPGEDSASGVTAYSDDGDVIAAHGNCPALHGTAILETEVVFGCGDGLLVVADDGSAEKLPYPASDDRRVGTFAHPADPEATLLLGHYGPSESTVALSTDLETGESEIVEIGAAYRAMADLGDGVGAVLTVTGELVTIDLSAGEVLERLPVIEPWSIPSGHGGVTPKLVVTADHIYATDPAQQRVIEILRTGHADPRVIEIGVVPTALAVVAPEAFPHMGH